MDDVRLFEKEIGFRKYQKDSCWGGFQVDFDRHTAFMYPSMVSPINLGISLLSVNLKGEKLFAIKVKEAFRSRTDKIVRRMKEIGNKGIKSLFTKGTRWAVDTAFGEEEDMKYTEFSGVFSFSDPTVISHEAFEVAKEFLTDFSDFEIKFWRMESVEDHKSPKEGSMYITILGGPGGFSDTVVTELKKSKYSSDEGRASYSALACVANYAWARRQIVKGLIEMAVYDAFGKSIKTKKLWDESLNIIYDDGQTLTYRKNAVGNLLPRLCKDENGIFFVDNDGKVRRMVSIDV